VFSLRRGFADDYALRSRLVRNIFLIRYKQYYTRTHAHIHLLINTRIYTRTRARLNTFVYTRAHNTTVDASRAADWRARGDMCIGSSRDAYNAITSTYTHTYLHTTLIFARITRQLTRLAQQIGAHAATHSLAAVLVNQVGVFISLLAIISSFVFPAERSLVINLFLYFLFSHNHFVIRLCCRMLTCYESIPLLSLLL
jgi:hypothetical protein